jgi:hypothetical protein
MRDPLGEPAVESVGAEGYDQGRSPQPSDQDGIQRSTDASDRQSNEDQSGNRKMIFAPRDAYRNGSQSERRTYGKVDAAGNEDGSEGDGEESQFHAEAKHFNQIGPNQKSGSNQRKQEYFGY